MYILKAVGKEPNGNVIFGENAEELIAKLAMVLNKRRENYIDLYE